jgi:methionyl-tRNA formyltransferase
VKVVFFGSGPVAAKSLELLSKHCEIEAVITKPRPAHHKGDVPVLDVCEELGPGRVLSVSNKQELSKIFSEQHFESRLGIVIDFGIIINQDVIDAFELGIVNSHFSLLPEWRGADPITFSILSGQARTGVSLMLINEKMDEGELLAQADYDMPEAVTTPLLTADLIELSDHALKEILPLYESGQTKPAPQLDATIADSSEPTYSRKLTKADSILDWNKPAHQLEREIRAFVEWPRSRTTIGTTDVIITAAHVSEASGTPGTISIEDKVLGMNCGEGMLIIDKLIPLGKKEMPASAFLAGHKL